MTCTLVCHDSYLRALCRSSVSGRAGPIPTTCSREGKLRSQTKLKADARTRRNLISTRPPRDGHQSCWMMRHLVRRCSCKARLEMYMSLNKAQMRVWPAMGLPMVPCRRCTPHVDHYLRETLQGGSSPGAYTLIPPLLGMGVSLTIGPTRALEAQRLSRTPAGGKKPLGQAVLHEP